MAPVPYTSKIERSGSSAISAVYYDSDTQRLYIKFVKQGFAGSIAGYSDVPQDVFEKFARAESVGKFYNRNFLGYGFEGYDLPPAPEMVDRRELYVNLPDNSIGIRPAPDVTHGYGEDGTVYQVSAIVDVYGADTPGQALDMVLRELEDYDVIRSEVSER